MTNDDHANDVDHDHDRDDDDGDDDAEGGDDGVVERCLNSGTALQVRDRTENTDYCRNWRKLRILQVYAHTQEHL